MPPPGKGGGVTETELTAERVAHNNAVFREANERIHGAVKAYDIGGLLPFLCECPDPTCTAIIRMPLETYEAIRAVPTHFINGAGHLDSAHAWSNVIERRDGYEIVEKTGRAAEIAIERDPRSG